ncbi:DUF2934 domain-containing protein [Paraburkholderia monticola]|uniref:DUF2934 domain-containing protein n=1 Tax=Paraburkholderia monticola TaxID=1399968 RepID=UPI003B9818BB
MALAMGLRAEAKSVPRERSGMQPETMEQRIRTRAYELWQADGSMEGCADEYWRKARSEVEAEVAEEQRQALKNRQS